VTTFAANLASFAVNHSDVFPIFCQPLADINTELADEFYARWVVVIEWKPLDTKVKPRRIVRSFRTSDSKHVIVNCTLWLNEVLSKLQCPELLSSRNNSLQFPQRWPLYSNSH